jgi:hypothetical protein
MNAIARLAAMPPRRRRLLARAWLLVLGYRAALYAVPFRRLHEVSQRRRKRSDHSVAPDEYAWAVQAAARRVPRATCLTQALALQSLLGSAGYVSTLRIGVAKEGADFHAHAWLECDGRIVIGGAEADRFTPFAPLRGGAERSPSG